MFYHIVLIIRKLAVESVGRARIGFVALLLAMEDKMNDSDSFYCVKDLQKD